MEDIFAGIRKLGEITGDKAKGIRLSDSLKLLMGTYNRSVRDVKNKKVLILISKESYFVFGENSYASDILNVSGATNAVDSLYDTPYPVLTAEYILKINPDIIIGGSQVGLDTDFFELHKELKRTDAYKNKQYFTVNDDYLSRPGPRVVEAVKIIHSIVKGEYSNKRIK